MMGVPEISAVDDIISSSASYQQRWFTLVLMSLFAAVALGLTSVGIYGVVAYSVARRVHEIDARELLRRGIEARESYVGFESCPAWLPMRTDDEGRRMLDAAGP